MARQTGAPEQDQSEIEITPEMMEAGAQAMAENFLALCDGDEFPETARTVYEAMEACRRGLARKDRRNFRLPRLSFLPTRSTPER